MMMLSSCDKTNNVEKLVTDFPLGWHSLEVLDFKNSYTYELRTKTSTGGVEVVADIDGDGRSDKVRLMQKNDRSACAIFATLNKKNGSFHTELIKYDGEYCTEGGQDLFVDVAEQRKSIKAFQFYIGAFEKGATLVYYENGSFIKIVDSD